MALGPKQMGEAILRNLEEKTGKSLEQWLTIVKKSKLTDKKSIIDFLKNTHSVGHFQAQKIFECFQGEDAYENIDNFRYVENRYCNKKKLQYEKFNLYNIIYTNYKSYLFTR